MLKWLKTLAAILLLPVCAGVASVLWRVIQASRGSDSVWVALVAGAGCWLVIYRLLPKPLWVYVLGHEVTHAISTWICCGRVIRFKVASRGGQVKVTKVNFFITLAPYFIPIYALAVGVVYALGNWLWDWRPYAVWFHILLGAAYAFHVTLTWQVLGTRQSDLGQEGFFFAGVIIGLGNLVALLFGVSWLTGDVALPTVCRWCGGETVRWVRWAGQLFR